MNDALIEVKIQGLVPSENGITLFLGNQEKIFTIQVDHGVGTNIALLLRGEKRHRPLTHELIGLIFKAFAISVQRIVINDLREDTYYARITLRAENEIHKKITEIDARPSDCLAIALETGNKIFVARKVWDQVTDVTAQFEENFDSETDESPDEEEEK